MKKGKYAISILLLMSSLCLRSQDTVRYTLQECHTMALTNSATARMQEETQSAAKYNRQAALAAMFPRVSANGGYMWNSRNAHLLANQTAFPFGTATVTSNGQASFEWSGDSPFGKLATASEGLLIHEPILELENETGQKIADAYQHVYDALTVDLTHVMVAQVGVTQPIYTGGRLTQLYKIAKATEQIANIEADAKHDDMIFSVDEAYWRMVSVAHKKDLAEQYYQLLCKLESDVTEAVSEGVATQADLMKVTTKRGEAEVKRLQASNGLVLSRMAVAQLCGLPLDAVFALDDSGLDETTLAADSVDISASAAARSEIQLLEEAEKIAKSNAKLAAAGLQPNIVANAGYIYTNPNAENGVRSDWKGQGFFSAGVVVNVPIVHADDILRYKAAKHAAKAVSLETEETRELLTLQTTQAAQKLTEAQQKIVLARLTQKNATEVLRMAEESFAAGMVTASELMQAQTAWLSAATDVVDAEVEAKTMETKLKKYTGRLRIED